MSKIMAVNSGSSSLKFQLFDMPSEKVLTSGNVERIGLEMGIFGINVNGEKISKEVPVPNHEVAVKLLLDALIEYGIVKNLDEIQGAGHRIVQGGPYFSGSVKVDDEVVEKVRELIKTGNIIVRQRGTKIHPGNNVGIGSDDTLFALIDGQVKFETHRRDRKQVSVYAV